jgi:phosphonate transport system ATP-binding protein
MIYSLSEISKDYPTRQGPVHSLKGLTFNVQPGEQVALLGPSGAGKSTLFRLLNATLRPTSGVLRFNGNDVGSMSGRELREMRQRIGTVYQQHYLVPSLTVLENALCGRLGRWSFWYTIRSKVRPTGSEIEIAMENLELVGLADKYRSRADELSGGQQQRLAIARMLMQNPNVILADEPFASLDPALTESMASLLMRLVEKGKHTLVTTLHDVEMALRYFPRIIALRQGQVVFDTTADRVSREAIDALYGCNSTPQESVLVEIEQWDKADTCGPRCQPSCAR